MSSELDTLRNCEFQTQVSRDMDQMSVTECGLRVKKLKNELVSLKGKAVQIWNG
jgi:hypothetical protein